MVRRPGPDYKKNLPKTGRFFYAVFYFVGLWCKALHFIYTMSESKLPGIKNSCRNKRHFSVFSAFHQSIPLFVPAFVFAVVFFSIAGIVIVTAVAIIKIPVHPGKLLPPVAL